MQQGGVEDAEAEEGCGSGKRAKVEPGGTGNVGSGVNGGLAKDEGLGPAAQDGAEAQLPGECVAQPLKVEAAQLPGAEAAQLPEEGGSTMPGAGAAQLPGQGVDGEEADQEYHAASDEEEVGPGGEGRGGAGKDIMRLPAPGGKEVLVRKLCGCARA